MTDQTRLLKAEIRRLRKELAGVTPSLDRMLRLRGFTVYKKDPAEDLLLPERKKDLDLFYTKLKKYSFRLFLRDVIKNQRSFSLKKVTRYSTREVSSNYIDFLLKTGVIERYGKGYRLRKRPIKSFGRTLEWFIARLMEKEFQAGTIRGVRFKRPKVGGDYDLIAKIDSLLLYMEIKSSPPKQVFDREITAFFNRVEDLSPDISVFFVDTELRMKDKIVPMFEKETEKRYADTAPVRRIVKELFHINSKIFIINSKDSIPANIWKVLVFRWHEKFQITQG